MMDPKHGCMSFGDSACAVQYSFRGETVRIDGNRTVPKVDCSVYTLYLTVVHSTRT